jgi:hypothetical protein
VNQVVLPHLRRQKQGLVVWVSSSSPTGVRVVDTPFGNRPFRVHIDPTEDGTSVGFKVLDAFAARCCIAWDCPTS